MTLDKLEGIQGDLVRTDDNWQDWDFPHLLEALRTWIIRNPPKHHEERQSQDKLPPHKPMKPFLPKNRSYQTRQEEPKGRRCVYCESVNHQSVNCDKVITLQERRRIEPQTIVLQLHRHESQGPRVSLFRVLQVLQPKTSLVNLP